MTRQQRCMVMRQRRYRCWTRVWTEKENGGGRNKRKKKGYVDLDVDVDVDTMLMKIVHIILVKLR